MAVLPYGNHSPEETEVLSAGRLILTGEGQVIRDMPGRVAMTGVMERACRWELAYARVQQTLPCKPRVSTAAPPPCTV